VLSLINDRYVDMIANPKVADVFRTRAKVLTTWMLNLYSETDGQVTTPNY